MERVRLNDALIVLEPLIQNQRFERVVQILESVLPWIDGSEEWNVLVELLESIPYSIRVTTPDLLLPCARILAKSKNYDRLFEFCDEVLLQYGTAWVAPAQVERAGALWEIHRYHDARLMLESAIPHLQGEILGIAWGKLGLTLFALGESWSEAFRQAYDSTLR